jgi:tRNA (cytidine/uridine-2'-O-)-methyltransferase
MTHDKPNFAPKIALYEPDIPQNTAAIIRTCSCLGANLEIIEPCGFLFNDKRFKRVAMDYINLKDIKFYISAEEFFKSKINERIILITTKAKKIYSDFNFRKNDTLLFGKESAGTPEKIHKLLKNKIKIPMINKKRSLNLSTSVAIILAESLRQINN